MQMKGEFGMAEYEKPILLVQEEISEGVYLASGEDTGDGTARGKCDSKYMNGVWHAPDYTNGISYIGRFGCNGCPAFRHNGCGLLLEDYWGSYDTDNGNRFPNWEKIGHAPDDPIDWSDVGSC